MSPQWLKRPLRLRTWLVALSVLSMLPLLLVVLDGIALAQRDMQQRMQDALRAQAGPPA